MSPDERGMGAGARLARVVARLRPTGVSTAPRDLGLRFALVGAVATLTLILFPPPGGYDVPVVRVGAIATDDVLAPFDFPILRGEEEYVRLQEQAALSVPPVYAVVPSRADTALTRVTLFLERFEGFGEDPAEAGPAALDRLGRREVGLRSSELAALTDPSTRQAVVGFLERSLPGAFETALLIGAEEMRRLPDQQIAVIRPDGTESIVPRSEILELGPGEDLPPLLRGANRADPEVERLAERIAAALAPPNLVARPVLTATRRSEARRSVARVQGEVLRGELIVAAHTRVTPEQAEMLESLATELRERRSGATADDVRAALGAVTIAVVLMLLFGFSLYLYRRDVFDEFRSVVVLALVWGLVTGLTAVFVRIDAAPPFSAPVALGAILVAMLWDTRLSVAFILFLTVYLSAQAGLGFPVLWTGLLGGLAGAWSVKRMRRRTQFFEILLAVVFGHVVAIGGLAMLRLWGWSELAAAFGWVALSAALSVFLASFLLPVFEWISGRTTDFTLLELADLNRPLLKQLLLEAPGTYHHSIIVGHLAEAALEGVGGNPLLARVGAYYHDIGKIRRPEFFAENLRGSPNPHDELTPEASARIVSRHVIDGVRMAQQAGLPDCVIDFIREHHGTTQLTYFWNKACVDDPGRVETPIGDFVYPGPRPRSVETAVVMLADSVEAASRLVDEPTPERFGQMIGTIVQMKLDQHQFDEADLSFHDLAVVEETFVRVLVGIHHHRIDYPSVSLHALARDDAADSLPSVGRSSS